MENRFVCYSSSSEEDVSEPSYHSNENQKTSASAPNPALNTECDEDISLEIVDVWDPTKENVFDQSNTDLPSESDSMVYDHGPNPDESHMVGCGRKERVTFSEGECQRLF